MTFLLTVGPPDSDIQKEFLTQLRGNSTNIPAEDAINHIPMYLVLLILSPDYLYLYAYVMLVWQLHSFYFDGYASLLRIVWKDFGKCNVIFVSFVLFATQIVLTLLYVL